MGAPEISRRQAWMKLAVLIADGLPEPKEINFPGRTQPDTIHMQFDTAEALSVWADELKVTKHTPHQDRDGDWIHTASTVMGERWHGWYISLAAYVKGLAEPEPVAEDLTVVRALAADVAPPAGDAVAAEVAAEAAEPDADGDLIAPVGEA